jgi:branched-chain amino acid transport system substrate-binding protein
MIDAQGNHEAPAAQTGSVAVRVRADGRFAPVDTRAGVELLGRLDPLARYAVAFARTQLRQTRFTWVDGARAWYAVCLTRERRPDGDRRPPGVLVELERSAPAYGLTVRELDVLTLICGGLSNPQIAAHLGMRTRTVSTHVSRIITKLGQSTRAGVAAVAMDQGLLRLPVPGSGRALGVLGVGIVDQTAAGLAPTAVRGEHPGWQRVLRRRLRPIRLGTLVGPSDADDDGREVREGSALAVLELNARGGVGGRLIEQVHAEVSAEDARGFGAGLRRLAEEDVDAVVGGYTHFLTPADYASVREHGCPIVTAMTSEEQAGWVRDDPAAFGRVFQVGPTEVNYGTGTIAFLEHLHAGGCWTPARRHILPIETPVDAGHPFGPVAREQAERTGWTVADPIVVGLHGVGWPAIMSRVRDEEPGVVVLTHFVPDEAAAFQRAFVAAGARALVVMIYAPSLPTFRRDAGAAAEGVIWSTVTGTYADALGRAFRRRYEATFGRPPGRSLAGSAYDQVHMLAQAWSRAADVHRFGDVAAELRRISHRGVNGSYFLGDPDQTGRSYPLETGDPSLGQAHLVFQVQDGVDRILHPAPYAESGFRLPAWLTPAGRRPAALRAPVPPALGTW